MTIFLEIFISYNLLYTDKNKQKKRRKAAQHPQLAGKLREAPGSSGKRREASAAPDSVRELRK